MAQHSPLPHRPRALIVDDEASCAISLEAEMHALGFDVCDLATDGQQTFLLAMSDQPDVVLMDVCLEGGREGIEVARRLREVATQLSFSSLAIPIALLLSASTNAYRERQCCRSLFIVIALLTPWRRSPGISSDFESIAKRTKAALAALVLQPW